MAGSCQAATKQEVEVQREGGEFASFDDVVNERVLIGGDGQLTAMVGIKSLTAAESGRGLKED